MPRRSIWSDSLTDKEIDGQLYNVKVTLQLAPADNDGKFDETQVDTFMAEWDLGGNSAEAVKSLVAHADLVDFMLRLRNQVSLATADSSVIRAWAKSAHPEFKVPERGRIPAEVTAAYRREVVAKVAASDAK